MCSNAICISWFSMKKCWYQQNSGVPLNFYIFWIFFRLDIAVQKCHHCRTLRYILGMRVFLVPPIHEQSRKKTPSSIALKSYIKLFKQHFVNSHHFLLQFYRTTEKVTKIKFVMVIVKSFDRYYHLFNLHILVTILFFFMTKIQAYWMIKVF